MSGGAGGRPVRAGGRRRILSGLRTLEEPGSGSGVLRSDL